VSNPPREARGRHGVVVELGLWSALYVAGVAFLAAQTLLGAARPGWSAAGYCFLIGFGVYLLDRVGVRRPDPADGTPWPGDVRSRHAARVAALLSLSVASVIGWSTRPGLALGPWIGLVVVAAYAWPSAWRLKDRLALKGPVVAISLVALGVVATAAGRSFADMSGAWPVTIGLVLMVLGDCVLSDLDDESADRVAGTGSIAAVVGPGAARTVALVCHAVSGVLLLTGDDHGPARAIWSGAMVLTTCLIVAGKPRRVRTLVDLRLPAVASIVWALAATETIAVR